jgi:hypothetical protein
MSNLALIQPQRVDFDTCQTCDWLDGLPIIGVPGVSGTLAGPENVGKASLVASATAGAALGVHKITVSAIVNGVVDLTVSGPSGAVTGFGVAGVGFYAGGLTMTLTQLAGQPALAVDDTFVVSVAPLPVDLTGLRFDLDARMSTASQTRALQASSGGAAPAIANGGPAGTVAMSVPRATMARCPVKLEGYPYVITATDPVTGQTVPAFYGLIHHAAIAAQIGA